MQFYHIISLQHIVILISDHVQKYQVESNEMNKLVPRNAR
jgi:hypothetical protein